MRTSALHSSAVAVAALFLTALAPVPATAQYNLVAAPRPTTRPGSPTWTTCRRSSCRWGGPSHAMDAEAQARMVDFFGLEARPERP